jgi:hypothetical protein
VRAKELIEMQPGKLNSVDLFKKPPDIASNFKSIVAAEIQIQSGRRLWADAPQNFSVP